MQFYMLTDETEKIAQQSGLHFVDSSVAVGKTCQNMEL